MSEKGRWVSFKEQRDKLRSDLEAARTVGEGLAHRAMEDTDTIHTLRARVERMEKVVEAAGRLATSLVPFRGSIDTWPVPQIKSRCRVNNGLYTIPEFRDAVIDALAALTPEKAKSEGERLT